MATRRSTTTAAQSGSRDRRD